MSKTKQSKNNKHEDCNTEVLSLIGKLATRLALDLYERGVMKKSPFLQFKFALKEVEQEWKEYKKSKEQSSK